MSGTCKATAARCEDRNVRLIRVQKFCFVFRSLLRDFAAYAIYAMSSLTGSDSRLPKKNLDAQTRESACGSAVRKLPRRAGPRMPTFCGGYLAAAIAAAVVLGPGLTVSPEQVSTLGYYGSDYEHQLCGQLGKRDMRRRAFTYYLQPHNLSSGVCVSECPALADELICDYTYQQSETKRSQHGKRCFAQLRTRASFLTCLPIDPGAASTVDAWLTAHTWDQIGADTLEASGVLFSCWCAAGLAGYLCLLGLRWLPRTTLFASLMGSLILAPAFGALLLSHGYDELASARQHATLGGAIITRDRRAAQAALAAGWVAVLSGVVLLVSLALRARHAPLAAAVLDAASHALQGLPASLLLLPLYVAIATGGMQARCKRRPPCPSPAPCAPSRTF